MPEGRSAQYHCLFIITWLSFRASAASHLITTEENCDMDHYKMLSEEQNGTKPANSPHPLLGTA